MGLRKEEHRADFNFWKAFAIGLGTLLALILVVLSQYVTTPALAKTNSERISTLETQQTAFNTKIETRLESINEKILDLKDMVRDLRKYNGGDKI